MRVESAEQQFGDIQDDIARLQEKGFSVVLMGDFHALTRLEEKYSQERKVDEG